MRRVEEIRRPIRKERSVQLIDHEDEYILTRHLFILKSKAH